VFERGSRRRHAHPADVDSGNANPVGEAIAPRCVVAPRGGRGGSGEERQDHDEDDQDLPHGEQK
jgi:hypothetical protein